MTDDGVQVAERNADPTLWVRDFRLFFTARTTSLLGDAALPVAITAAMLEAGYGISGVGYGLAAHLAPFAGFMVFGGVLSDRLGARRLMIFADFVRLAVQLVLAGLLLAGPPPLWVILALLAMLGTGGALFQPGVASVTPRLASDVQRANAVLRIAESSTVVFGPAVAGGLLALMEPAAVIAFDALTFGASGCCLLLLRLAPLPARDGPKTSLRGDLFVGWREFVARRWLWQVVAVWMLFQLGSWGPTLTLTNGLLVDRLGASTFGLVMSAMGLGSVLGGVLAIKLRPMRPLRAATVAMFFYVLIPLSSSFDHLSAPMLGACYCVGGASMAFWGVMFHTSVQTHVPVQFLGRVHAYDAAGSLMMKPVGQALAGPMAGVIGAVQLLHFATGIGIVVCLILLSLPAVRNLSRNECVG
ncbi:MFS transporter [Streptomyces sp. Je 1-369]|uniref:MFS transporter n=1 Tax=Streptomyces sp. Je 1-369 TaxID=2966192 RepID=UPI00228559CA|nr:MFS transporter [Streptomyces sp. Je 1-369]WAL96408.1 MFS transporter [Streptomyces sp. Je 1-369]